ncbi:hypothetical protein [uncultured Dubosiella sp.]|uniref:hypothetical protein n=1 Tax=uncultured Dubosiella sp. TaxID=1937011 RepID=UPI0025B4C706|nr:hypothetical protein [uncultured Dubosiella sp.]
MYIISNSFMMMCLYRPVIFDVSQNPILRALQEIVTSPMESLFLSLFAGCLTLTLTIFIQLNQSILGISLFNFLIALIKCKTNSIYRAAKFMEEYYFILLLIIITVFSLSLFYNDYYIALLCGNILIFLVIVLECSAIFGLISLMNKEKILRSLREENEIDDNLFAFMLLLVSIEKKNIYNSSLRDATINGDTNKYVIKINSRNLSLFINAADNDDFIRSNILEKLSIFLYNITMMKENPFFFEEKIFFDKKEKKLRRDRLLSHNHWESVLLDKTNDNLEFYRCIYPNKKNEYFTDCMKEILNFYFIYYFSSGKESVKDIIDQFIFLYDIFSFDIICKKKSNQIIEFHKKYGQGGNIGEWIILNLVQCVYKYRNYEFMIAFLKKILERIEKNKDTFYSFVFYILYLNQLDQVKFSKRFDHLLQDDFNKIMDGLCEEVLSLLKESDSGKYKEELEKRVIYGNKFCSNIIMEEDFFLLAHFLLEGQEMLHYKDFSSIRALNGILKNLKLG